MKSNNLRTFKILFLVKGILTSVFSLFFVIYAIMGMTFAKIPELTQGPTAPPFNIGYLFLTIGIVGFCVSITLGTLALFASKYIGERKKHTFIIVAAAANCLTGILGILLCIFTLIELTKPEVKALFNGGLSDEQLDSGDIE